MAVKRVNITMDEEHLAVIDSYAAKKHVGRSAAVTFLTGLGLQYEELMKSIPVLVGYMAKEQGQDAST